MEKDYYERTGIFPIMHTIVFRREVYEANPWAATSLYAAFVEAKQWAYAQLMETDALKVTLPWVVAETEETRRVMGDDFWPYGIEPNRVSLEALPRFLYEQNLISRVPEIEELFAPNTVDVLSEEARGQSLAVAGSGHSEVDQSFVDAISENDVG